MNILFLGADSGTSRHRAAAMRRLGHGVRVVTPDAFLPGGKSWGKFHYETGGLLAASAVAREVLAEADKQAAEIGRGFDAVWVDGGRYVGPPLIRSLRRRFGAPVLNFNHDDPYGKRDRFSWALCLRAVPEYDLLIVRRKPNIAEAQAHGARRVLFRYLTADEAAHAPRPIDPERAARWRSDVSFIGTWMPERGPFMKALIERGVPLALYGNRWERAPEWPVLRPFWKGPGTTSDDDYALAIQSAKVCLGLLSKGNRDLHTRRSVEIPALGGLLCAERTGEHCELYRENEEAVFWKDAAECAAVCLRLLADEAARCRIAARGHARCQELGLFNEPMCAAVLEEAVALSGKTAIVWGAKPEEAIF